MIFGDLILMGGGPGAEGGGNPVLMIGWFVLLFLLFYLMLIRPQQKRQKKHAQLLSELKKGDRVVTTSGMFGTIFAISDEDNKVVLKINDQTKLEFLKSAISERVES